MDKPSISLGLETPKRNWCFVNSAKDSKTAWKSPSV